MVQYPPEIEKVENEINNHLLQNSNLAQVFEVYRKILLVQVSLIDRIKTEVSLSEEEFKECLRKNQYVMSCQDIKVDGRVFLELLKNVCKAIKDASPDAPDKLLHLIEDQEFQEDEIDNFLQQIKAFDKKELEQFIQEKQIHTRTGLDSEVISFVIFSSISPFYSSFMNMVSEKVDFSIWRNNFCPVCGQKPVIAKHRSEDGARILECWLCHAQWYFPRMECPHCDNKEQENLRFFYVPGDKARQVHVCEKCKHYLKTVDGKMLQKDVILDVEAIATGHLDVLAKEEGYTLPERAGILN